MMAPATLSAEIVSMARASTSGRPLELSTSARYPAAVASVSMRCASVM
jgi:hypothetical protein